ncbi:baseplate J/gp47 family protein [Bosea minatitlanensis]|uniref:Baseplate J/gp47 family protein n=1 Tax=Bosea minatitlanensis TaxID=128782 RepID=A0ABW0EZQ3_9HYPH|nr:baseplate J/gp47 family protein [Bosea minatitlanensis]MCT4491680.1 baseplate J/gp47 family protein [Bosea minatitlanensis]
MAFSIPTLRDLVERTRLAFRANLPGSDAWLWPNNVGPTAKVLAGLTHEVFGYADWIARQKFALTADGDSLDLHGAELGMSRRPAAAAAGSVAVVSTAALVVDAGAVLSRSDGFTYRAASGGVLAGAGTLSLPVIAEEAGKSGIARPGTVLLALSGFSGPVTIAVGAEGVASGADAEGDEAFRQRILFRKRNPPQGGSAADYVIWASEIPGVTRVFVERLFNGPGTVRVFPLFDDDYDGGIAPPARIVEVAEYLDSQRPAGAALTVAAPAARVIDVEIAGLSPGGVAVEEAVRQELASTFRRLGRVTGADAPSPSMPYLATAQVFSRSWIWQSAANAAGEQSHVVVDPASDIAVPIGSVPVLGSVTFT